MHMQKFNLFLNLLKFHEITCEAQNIENIL